MKENLWQQGIDLMLFGMGTVFVFLTLLVIFTMIMSMLVRNFLGEEPEPALATADSDASGSVSPKTVAIIQAAIHAHRARQK